jgi:hypothetical protein
MYIKKRNKRKIFVLNKKYDVLGCTSFTLPMNIGYSVNICSTHICL